MTSAEWTPNEDQMLANFNRLRILIVVIITLSVVAAAVAFEHLRRQETSTASSHTDFSARLVGQNWKSELTNRGGGAFTRSVVTTDSTLRPETQLIAGNGAANDVFGTSVAISGNTAIVQSANPGGLYIFVRNGGTWTQQAQFAVPGRGPVAISGDTAIVGAPGDDDSRGAVFVFVRSGATWSQQAKLIASDGVPTSFDGIPGDNFGWSVGISGDVIIIGAPYKNNTLGAAYVFERSGETWDEDDELTATEPETGDFFGGSVSISGDTVIVGVSGDNLTPESVHSEGSAYVFVKTAAWSVQEILVADESDNSFNFGRAVAISGDTAIVGSEDAAYVFRRSGAWSSPQRLQTNPGEGLTGEGFGDSVAISGDLAIVGALKAPCDQGGFLPCTYRGSAYAFARNDDNTWSEDEKLLANDGADFDQFGYSIAVSDDTVLVGSPAHDIGANTDQGAVYVYLKIHDLDDDGLPDNWETNGITVDAAGAVSVGDTGNGVFIDLHAMGADPMHKDVFIHADWMRTDPSRPGSTFKPSWRAIKMVTDAFAIAPVTNPDGTPGINLHLDLGSDSVMNPVTNEMWNTFSRAGDIPFQESVGVIDIDGDYNWGEVDTIKMSHFQLTRRNVAFHYALFCNTFADRPNSGIARGIPSADFLVTLGHPSWTTPGGTVMEQAGTLMHELGHDLGLHHGGNDDVNTKPNYLSVMNYDFQMTGLLLPNGTQRSFDYSRSALPTLNEQNLDEVVGISDPEMHLTLWSKRTRLNSPPGANKCVTNPDGYFSLLVNPATDWDCDAARNSMPVVADINGDGICVSGGANGVLDTPLGGDDEIRSQRIVSGPNRTCDTTAAGDDVQQQSVGFVEPDLLAGFSDWPALKFDGGGKIGALGSAATEPDSSPNDEPTIEQLFDVAPPGLVAAGQTAPLDVVTISAPPGGAPLPVTFDGSGSTAVNGTIVNYFWNFGDGFGTTGSASVVMHTYANPGTYFASLTVTDSNGRLNLVPLLTRITVTGGPPPSPTPTPSPTPNGPNLTPYQPPGWSDKIVVSNTPNTNTDTPLISTDTLYVDAAIINNGNIVTPSGFVTTLYVDGNAVHSFDFSAIQASTYTAIEDFNIGSLSAGQHTIKIVADANGVITESDETDNEYSRVIDVALAPPPTPTPTPTPGSSPETFTVKNTNDSGPDSLRQAILDANNHTNATDSMDVIDFDIPGPGVHTITPASLLPTITEAVLIDGYTQPGASANTLAVGDNAVLLIELSGANRVDVGLDLSGGDSTVRGLAINHFDANIFTSVAIRLGSSRNVVAGNFLGTNAAGDAAVNNVFGVRIESGADNLIGGTTPSERNIFAGNASPNSEDGGGVGIQIRITETQPGTRVQGNYIGTNAAGNAPLGNFRGIDIQGTTSASVTIGGLTPTPGTGAGNLISGNSRNGGISGDGIFVSNRPGDLIIQGNLIGFDATGTVALHNGVSGIHFQDAVPGTSMLLVGGTEPGARNVIFNNRISGLVSNAIGLLVQGNFICTDITGSARPAGSQDSGGDGIQIGDGSATIGGDSPAAGNVFSCHGPGLHLAGGVTTVQGNFFGTAADGSTPFGNDNAGVRVDNSAVGTIGGVGSGQGNLIAHNLFAGVEVRNSARVAILGNSIFDNGTTDPYAFQDHPGIDLNGDGVTFNDACDSDPGPNGLQNYPALTTALATSSTIKFVGLLNSKASTSFRVEFFSNPSCEVSGNGEGQTFVGSTIVTSDESCDAPINITLPVVVAVGQFISATATDPDGNTSEFGPCVQVTAENPTAADGSVSGRITDGVGSPVAGVALRMSGTQDRLTVTDAQGNYQFDNVQTNGFYTVIPSRANYTFTPSERSFSQLGQLTEARFTAVPAGSGLNPLSATEYFVRQQYVDFLGREPDEAGLKFWVNNIDSCGDDAECRDVKRVDTSAAFFLSIEFQQTGYLVYRTYLAAFGNMPDAPVPLRLAEFKLDAGAIGSGVVVQQFGWEQVLENNKRAFMSAFVQRPAFAAVFPATMTATQFVDTLNTNSGHSLSQAERNLLIIQLSGGAMTRAQVLQALAEHSDLTVKEFNRAFVLMEYFGYLRRNPDDPPDTDYRGFDFWLTKLNQFNGNFREAQMVKAFIMSSEYRGRFVR